MFKVVRKHKFLDCASNVIQTQVDGRGEQGLPLVEASLRLNVRELGKVFIKRPQVSESLRLLLDHSLVGLVPLTRRQLRVAFTELHRLNNHGALSLPSSLQRFGSVLVLAHQ